MYIYTYRNIQYVYRNIYIEIDFQLDKSKEMPTVQFRPLHC